MAKNSTTPLEALGALASMVIALAVGSLLTAYVGITLYKWFLLPLGLPALAMGQLYGVIYFAKYLLYQDTKSDDSEESLGARMLTAIVKSFVWAGLYLGMGWVIHSIIY
jgi:hypothetical protein